MPVEWPKLALDWLFAQLLKWNRSACPRVCVISMSFAYVNRPHLSLRGCTERRSRFVGRGRLRSKWESPSPVIPPSQTRCLGRSNTGPDHWLFCLLHSHTARPAHQLLSTPTVLPDLPLNKGSVQPAAPSWEGKRPSLMQISQTLINIIDHTCV